MHGSFSFIAIYFSTASAGAACGGKYGVASNCQLCSVKTVAGDGINKAPVKGWIDAINHIKAYCTASKSLCVVNIQNWPNNDDGLNAAVISAIDVGVVTVIAAGYTNTNACFGLDQAIKEAITVGFVKVDDQKTDDSNWGPCVDVYALGENVIGPGIGSSTEKTTTEYSGVACKFLNDADVQCSSLSLLAYNISFSIDILIVTAILVVDVTGIAAAIRSANPTWTPAQVKEAIKKSSPRLPFSDMRIATVGDIQCSQSWGLDRINQCSLPLDNFATKQSASGVKVFIVGSGIYREHEEFTGIIGPAECHKSVIVNEAALVDVNGWG